MPFFGLDSVWDDMPVSGAKVIPKDMEAVCYVCQRTYTTYRGIRTLPPDPALVRLLSDVQRVDTCGSNYCERMEMKRQDALVQMILAPLRDAYYESIRKAKVEQRQGQKPTTKQENPNG